MNYRFVRPATRLYASPHFSSFCVLPMSIFLRTFRAHALYFTFLLGITFVPRGLAATPPDMSVTFGFEPRLGIYSTFDPKFEDHHYAPVDSSLLLAWGLRGRLFFDTNLFAELAMTYGLRVSPGNPAPTITTLSETAAGIGYRSSKGLLASLSLGFSSLTQSVSSTIDGGALVYLGPSVHPRIGWTWLASRPLGWAVAITTGVNLHFPIGSPHTNPLWEEPFRRALLPSFTLGIESGFGTGQPL